MRRLSGEKLKHEDFYIKKSALLMFNYFTQSSQRGKARKEKWYLARQGRDGIMMSRCRHIEIDLIELLIFHY